MAEISTNIILDGITLACGPLFPAVISNQTQ